MIHFRDITQRSYYTMVCVTCEKDFKSQLGIAQNCKVCSLKAQEARINEANRRSGLPPLSMG
jgi:rRNA maturation endonuclease Nob1